MPYNKDQFRARMTEIERAEREAVAANHAAGMQIVIITMLCSIIGLSYLCLKWSQVVP